MSQADETWLNDIIQLATDMPDLYNCKPLEGAFNFWFEKYVYEEEKGNS